MDYQNILQQPLPKGEVFRSPNFTGDVWLAPLAKDKSAVLTHVTFAPGSINAWHNHSMGQLLIVTGGKGFYQERGSKARLLYRGDVVEIAPGVEHWHGAAPGCYFSHIAVNCHPEINTTTWLKPIGIDAYHAAVAESLKPSAEDEGQLSDRERAIVLIGCTTGASDIDALAEGLRAGLNAGMTVNELKEILTQAYAYCGFPRAIRGMLTLKNVLEQRKAQGNTDVEGKAAEDVSPNSRYDEGSAVLAELSGVETAEARTGMEDFAPGLNLFLREHLFCDIFRRGLLSFKERELATVAIIVGVGGVEPMAKAHADICRRLGWTRQQLTALVHLATLILGNDKKVSLD